MSTSSEKSGSGAEVEVLTRAKRPVFASDRAMTLRRWVGAASTQRPSASSVTCSGFGRTTMRSLAAAPAAVGSATKTCRLPERTAPAGAGSGFSA